MHTGSGWGVYLALGVLGVLTDQWGNPPMGGGVGGELQRSMGSPLASLGRQQETFFLEFFLATSLSFQSPWSHLSPQRKQLSLQL